MSCKLSVHQALVQAGVSKKNTFLFEPLNSKQKEIEARIHGLVQKGELSPEIIHLKPNQTKNLEKLVTIENSMTSDIAVAASRNFVQRSVGSVHYILAKGNEYDYSEAAKGKLQLVVCSETRLVKVRTRNTPLICKVDKNYLGNVSEIPKMNDQWLEAVKAEKIELNASLKTAVCDRIYFIAQRSCFKVFENASTSYSRKLPTIEHENLKGVAVKSIESPPNSPVSSEVEFEF